MAASAHAVAGAGTVDPAQVLQLKGQICAMKDAEAPEHSPAVFHLVH
jgi:hypothetical protein